MCVCVSVSVCVVRPVEVCMFDGNMSCIRLL